jgi:hypothetical protein
VRFLRRVVILDVRGIYFMLSSIITGVMLREDIQTEDVQVVAMSPVSNLFFMRKSKAC